MAKTKVFILGGGTLGKFLVELLESSSEFCVGGVYDDNYPALKNIFKYKVLGKLSDASCSKPMSLALGIGEPRHRKQIFEREVQNGHFFPSIIHPSAVVSKYAVLKEGIALGPNSSVLSESLVERGSCILSHVNINQKVTIEPFCLIGAGAIIGNNARLQEGCHIGMGVKIIPAQSIEAWSYYNH